MDYHQEPLPPSSLREAVEREIDLIAAEFHALLSSEQAEEIGCIYAYCFTSSSEISDRGRTIGQQVFRNFEWAVEHGVHVPRDHIFFDTGRRRSRRDLDRLRFLLGRGSATILLVFATHRLFRDLGKALGFVEEHVLANNARGVFTGQRMTRGVFAAWDINMSNRLEWALVRVMSDPFVDFTVGPFTKRTSGRSGTARAETVRPWGPAKIPDPQLSTRSTPRLGVILLRR